MFKRFFYLVSVAVMAISLFGCAGKTYKATSDFETRIGTVKKVGIVVPTVAVNTVGFGGPVLDQERTAKGKKSMELAILKAFNENGFEGKLLSSANYTLTNMEQQLLTTEHSTMVASTRLLKKDNAPLPELKVADANFATIKNVYERNGVDAIAVFTGVDNNLSGGKIAANILANIITVPFGITLIPHGLAHEQLSILTKDGNKIFVNEKTKSDWYFHMENEDDAADFAQEVVIDISEAAKRKI